MRSYNHRVSGLTRGGRLVGSPMARRGRSTGAGEFARGVAANSESPGGIVWPRSGATGDGVKAASNGSREH